MTRPDWVRRAALTAAVLGLAYYAALTAGWLFAPDMPYFGSGLYDAYWLSITEGRLDVPPRLAYFEGHYAGTGEAYLYHGAGPLVLRAALSGLIDLRSTSLASLFVFLCAGLGTGLYHLAFHAALRQALQGGAAAAWASLGLGAAVWFGGPGALLAASTTFYHEPAAMAYALTGGFVLLLTRVWFGQTALHRAIIPLALIAAATLHARPNVAVGLYLGVAMIGLWGLASSRRWSRYLPRGVAAAAILASSGLAMISLNEAKFGDPLETHGTYAEEGGLLYGPVFWNMEAPDSPRAQAFVDYGRFNPRRIAPNAVLYFGALPQIGPAGYLGAGMVDAYHEATDPHLGFIRVERPSIGMLLLWPAWFVVAAYAVRGAKGRRGLAVCLGGGLLAATLLTLSYGTVTLRYRFDLWPFLAFLVVLGLPALVARLRAEGPQSVSPRVLGIFVGGLALVGAAATTQTARIYSGAFGVWAAADAPTCLETYGSRGFDAAQARRHCR